MGLGGLGLRVSSSGSGFRVWGLGFVLFRDPFSECFFFCEKTNSCVGLAYSPWALLSPSYGSP